MIPFTKEDDSILLKGVRKGLTIKHLARFLRRSEEDLLQRCGEFEGLNKEQIEAIESYQPLKYRTSDTHKQITKDFEAKVKEMDPLLALFTDLCKDFSSMGEKLAWWTRYLEMLIPVEQFTQVLTDAMSLTKNPEEIAKLVFTNYALLPRVQIRTEAPPNNTPENPG